ncbi:MAG: hypothetical protein ACR2ND_09930 [Solirubrobacteraceae bacterium]
MAPFGVFGTAGGVVVVLLGAAGMVVGAAGVVGTGVGAGAVGAGAAAAADVCVIVVGGGVIAVSLRSSRATPKPIAAIDRTTSASSSAVAARQRGAGAMRVRAAAPHCRHQLCSGASGVAHAGQRGCTKEGAADSGTLTAAAAL